MATAIGYYRIRKGDSWPGAEKEIKGRGERTLTNSEVRAYSWPAVLVFVEKWVPPEEFGPDSLEKMVPPTLYLPDGRTVPVCVISAPKDVEAAKGPDAFAFPLNNIGSGHPVIVTVQGREHVATIACLVTDGHRVYALTNRHVTGDDGNVVDSVLGGVRQRIGLAAADQITRLPFSDVYPGWPGRSTYVNLDVGLIDVDDLDDWTARLQDDLLAGQMVNLSSVDFPLALIGRHVRGCGAASGWMLGEISALFYRYKSRGGFEYVSDFFIGPRTPVDEEEQIALLTRAGDSGTLWLLEPEGDAEEVDDASVDGLLRPLAIQWGANRLYSGLDAQSHSYALATNISLACDRLDLDFVRDWNLDQDDTWAAFGHFTIASRVVVALSNAVPKLKTLMEKNASIVSHPDDVLLSSEFKKMGEDPFVALADVPDFFWKHGKQGGSPATMRVRTTSPTWTIRGRPTARHCSIFASSLPTSIPPSGTTSMTRSKTFLPTRVSIRSIEGSCLFASGRSSTKWSGSQRLGKSTNSSARPACSRTMSRMPVSRSTSPTCTMATHASR
ncbi:hypothetical protein ACCS72_27810 [Rhizobium ruizarguesonis]